MDAAARSASKHHHPPKQAPLGSADNASVQIVLPLPVKGADSRSSGASVAILAMLAVAPSRCVILVME